MDDARVIDRPRARVSSRTVVRAAGVFVAALIVLSVGSGTRPFWLDEQVTLDVVRRPFGALFRVLLDGDPALAPYYFAMWPWHLLSDSVFWMRFPSALAMALATTMLFCWVCRRTTFPAGLSVAFIFLCMAPFTRYAQEARPYAFAVLFAVIATMAWDTIARRAQVGRGSLVVYVGSLVLLGLSNALSLALVFGHLAGTVLIRDRRRALVAILTAFVVAVVLLAPFLLLAKDQRSDRMFKLNWDTAMSLVDFPGGSLAITVVLTGLAVTALLLSRAKPEYRTLAIVGLIWWLVPSGALLLAGFAFDKITQVPRYYVAFAPGLALAAGIGLALLIERSQWWLIAVPVVIALAIPAGLDARTAAEESGQGSLDLEAALVTPALSDLPVLPDPITYMQLAALSPEMASDRMPASVDPTSTGAVSGSFYPGPESLASLEGLPAAIITFGRKPASADQARALARSAGMDVLHVSCGEPDAHLEVVSRSNTAESLPSPSVIADQVQRATGGRMRCTPG